MPSRAMKRFFLILFMSLGVTGVLVLPKLYAFENGHRLETHPESRTIRQRNIVAKLNHAAGTRPSPKDRRTGAKESTAVPVIEFLSPRDGAKLRQQQPNILIKGRVTPPGFRDPNLDVFFCPRCFGKHPANTRDSIF